MKIGRPFRNLNLQEYIYYIDHYRKYTDFNTLGLYRSVMENTRLSTDDKHIVIAHAHKSFKKAFDFLQLKDPQTYFDIVTMGQELTKGEADQIWKDIRAYQQKTLRDKKIKHRNFGSYSKHDCGYDTCHLNGLMIRAGSVISYGHMHFKEDKNKYPLQDQSERHKRDRKQLRQLIRKQLETS